MEANRYNDFNFKNWKNNDPRLNKLGNMNSKDNYFCGQQQNGEFHANHGTGHGVNMGAKSQTKKDYKLLIDPAIKKGHQKVYRYDGSLPGQPPIIPRDPRPPKSRLWTTTQAELPVPRLKIDKYYVGVVPETTVRFGCLNDNVDKKFLYELCSKYGDIEECKVYYDPKTKKHLGTGKCVYTRSHAARLAASSLDGMSVMGNRIYVTLDKPKPTDSRSSHHGSHRTHGHAHGIHGHRRHSSSSSTSGHDQIQQRDPRLLYPTPSPSSASSIESTPPTPQLGWNNRHHPVALMKSEHLGVSRQLPTGARDIRPLPTPSSASPSASSVSSVRSFEPVSPPPLPFPLHVQAAPLPAAPLPPSDRDDPPPPPPPPPNVPPRTNIEYEDISPSNNFDDDPLQFPSHGKGRDSKPRKDGAHYMTSAPKTSMSKEGSKTVNDSSSGSLHKKACLKAREGRDVDSTTPNSQGSRTSSVSSNSASRRSSKTSKPGMYETIDSPDYKQKEFNLPKPVSEPAYEAISDSEEQQGTYEDISPVGSPQTLTHPVPKTVPPTSRPRLDTQKQNASPVVQSSLRSADGSLKESAVMKPPDISNQNAEQDLDDNDDAMSLSSISSNEDTTLELNTPAVSLQTNAAPPVSSIQALPVPPMAFPARISLPPPPIYPSTPPVIPPAPVPVRRPMAALPPAPPPPSVMPPYPRYPPNIPPPAFPSHQNFPPPYRRNMSMMYSSLYPQGVPPVRNPPLPPPGYNSGFMGQSTANSHKEHRSQLPFKFQARESSSKAIDKDLKAVLSRDVLKRLVEHSGFKAFEAWWDNQTKNKAKDSTNRHPLNSATSSIVSPLTPCKLEGSDKAQSAPEATDSMINTLIGTLAKPGVGNIHGGFPKLPSFRIARKTTSVQPMPTVTEAVRKRSASHSSTTSPHKSPRMDQSDDDDDDVDELVNLGLESHIAKAKREQMAFGQGHIRQSCSVYDAVYSSGSDEDESGSDGRIGSTKPAVAENKYTRTPAPNQQFEEGKDEGEEDEEEEDEDEDDDEDDDTKVDDGMEEDDEEEDEDEEDFVSDDESVSSYSEEEEEVEEKIEEEKEAEECTDNKLPEGDADLMHDAEMPHFDHKEFSLAKEEREVRERCSSHDSTDQVSSLGQEKDGLSSTEISTKETVAALDESIVDSDLSSAPQVNESIKTLDELPMKGILPDESTPKQQNDKAYLNGNSSKESIEGREQENLWKFLLMSEHSYSGTVDAKPCEEEVNVESNDDPEIVTFDRAEEEGYGTDQTKEHALSEDHEPARLDQDESLGIDNRHVPFDDTKSAFDDMLTGVDESNVELREQTRFCFPMRSIEEEDRVLSEIFEEGLDLEDVGYLKTAFESLNLMGSDVVESLTWCEHPETKINLPTKHKKGKGELRAHKTGCARSEGYYKITDREKEHYLLSVQKQLVTKSNEEAEVDKDGTKHKQLSRENRVMQRRLASSFVNEDFGDLIKFNQFKLRKKHLRFAKSNIHNWGLFACEPIAAEEMVIEYVGQVIRSIAADEREKRYEELGIGSSYLFRMDADTVIDATKNGNNARFINHSCTPNCYAKIISVEGSKKIVIYSKRDIKVNEEITYDYKFPLEDEKIPCLCGTPQCRGTLN